jgi:hypothetical protein
MRTLPEQTARRVGLQATAEIYLKDVSVDPAGFVVEYTIAFLPPGVDADEITQITRDAINVDEPERIRLYDEQDRYLAGHPGTPDERPAKRRLARAISRAIRQLARPAGRTSAPRGLVVINGGGVPEHVWGPVTVVDFSDLPDPDHSAQTVESLAEEVQAAFGDAARATVEDLRELAANKRTQDRGAGA